mmetsp:Transcript_9286/g.13601  ORF Transcript_9286/g.13601 Transcript_9286/m.13601 type:complete len:257 (-) Transcript_9286:9-779(-)
MSWSSFATTMEARTMSTIREKSPSYSFSAFSAHRALVLRGATVRDVYGVSEVSIISFPCHVATLSGSSPAALVILVSFCLNIGRIFWHRKRSSSRSFSGWQSVLSGEKESYWFIYFLGSTFAALAIMALRERVKPCKFSRFAFVSAFRCTFLPDKMNDFILRILSNSLEVEPVACLFPIACRFSRYVFALAFRCTFLMASLEVKAVACLFPIACRFSRFAFVSAFRCTFFMASLKVEAVACFFPIAALGSFSDKEK